MSNITHAGVTHRIGDVEYEFAPLQLEDIEYLEMWLKTRVIEAGNAAAKLVPPHEGDRIIKMACEQAAEIDVLNGDFKKLLTVGGVSRMLWRMVTKKHPNVKVDDVTKWVMNAEISKALLPKLDLLSNMTNGEEPTGNGQVPLRRPRKGRR